MNNTSNETIKNDEGAYNEACEKANVAYEVFALIRQSYRAGLTDDDTFLAAKAVYAKAQAEYDKAFAAASDVATTDTTTLCGCGAAVRVEDGGEPVPERLHAIASGTPAERRRRAS